MEISLKLERQIENKDDNIHENKALLKITRQTYINKYTYSQNEIRLQHYVEKYSKKIPFQYISLNNLNT